MSQNQAKSNAQKTVNAQMLNDDQQTAFIDYYKKLGEVRVIKYIYLILMHLK